MKTVLSCSEMLSSFSSVILRFILTTIIISLSQANPIIARNGQAGWGLLGRERGELQRGKMNVWFWIINIFISSNMLDLLELADAGKTKPRDRESPAKEERFNVLLARLRERNLHNEDFIRRYRQKAARKKAKFPEIAARIASPLHQHTGDPEDEDPTDVPASHFGLPAEQPKKCSQKTIGARAGKEDPLKQTNHTLTEDVSSDDEKTLSFPNLDYCGEGRGTNRPKKTFQNLKQDKEFNKYLRNVFFKEVSTKMQRNQVERQSGQRQDEPRRSMGRMKTEMATSKYKLNIKSLIFGNLDSEGKSQKRIEPSDKPRRPDVLEKLRNMQRYERDQFEDDRLSSKGLLPTIHNHQVTKNKRFLQNYIKYNNHDRPLPQPQPEVRTLTLPNDPDIARKDAMPSRIGLSLRIQTICIQKSP